MILGDTIADLRIERNLTREQFAREIQLDANWLRMVEESDIQPSAGMRRCLENALHVRRGTLLEDTNHGT